MISNLKRTLIIAEGCDNHFGKLDNAKKMVLMAKKKWRRCNKVSTSSSR